MFVGAGFAQGVLLDWTVIGLRASTQQAALRSAVRAAGATFLSMPGLRLRAADNAELARAALQTALDCPACIFTSPASVNFARRLLDLANASGCALAIGSGTASALRRAGVRQVLAPAASMRSEGLLALEPLNPPPARIGLVTAPGGRGEIARALAARGAQVELAEVYQRGPAPVSRQSRRRLVALNGPLAVLASSAEALTSVTRQLGAAERDVFLRAVAVCASERLQRVADDLGFRATLECGSTLPRAQLEALHAHVEAKNRLAVDSGIDPGFR